MGKKKSTHDPYRVLSSESSSSDSETNVSAQSISQEKNTWISRSEPTSPPRNDGSESLSKKWSPLRKKHTRTKSADDIDANIMMPATRAVLDDLKEASAGGFPQFNSGEAHDFSKVTSSTAIKGRLTPDSASEEKASAAAISYFKQLPPPPPPPPSVGILRLTNHKHKRSPKVTSSGIVKYAIPINHDADSEASSISSASDAHGYTIPFPLQRTKHIREAKLSNSSESSTSDDELSIRTPIPKAPPDASRSVMPDAFLRDHHLLASGSNLSDLSEEEESVAKRRKRELKNVGRLVQAAKQQQSFAQAWFSAGKGDNVLPQLQPKNRQSQKSMDDGPSGPIDLDSGESWEGPGGFNFIAHSNTNTDKSFIKFGGGGADSDRRCCKRILCTIGNIRCTQRVFLVVVFLILGAIAGSTISAIMLYSSRSTLDITSMPSFIPTVIPTTKPTEKPSKKPSVSPSMKPSSTPSRSPSLLPTRHPSKTPSKLPSYSPSLQPSILPSLSQIPSLDPTGSPTTFFSATTFDQVGGDVTIVNSISNDRNGHSVKLSKDSRTMVVGSLTYPNVFGSVRVYQRSDLQSPWITKGQRIIGSQSNSGTGEVVDISDDGTRIVMSEYGTNGGIVKVFDYNSVTFLWEQVGSNIEGLGGDFGFSLSMSGDGQRIAVGAYALELVFTYTLQGNATWTEMGYPIQEMYFGGKFGWSVSLSKDGNVLAIGAPDAAGDGVVFPEGYVSVYEYNGSIWTPRGSQIMYKSVFQEIRFGFSISLSEDGSFVAIGATKNSIQFEDIDSFPSGSVSVYTFIDESWQQVGNDLLGIPSPFQEFGYKIALSRNGRQVVIGAPYSDSGKVFIYRYNGYIWEEARVLSGQNTDVFFGFAVDASEDDNSGCLSLIAVGAPGSPLGKGVLRTYQVNYIGPCS